MLQIDTTTLLWLCTTHAHAPCRLMQKPVLLNASLQATQSPDNPCAGPRHRAVVAAVAAEPQRRGVHARGRALGLRRGACRDGGHEGRAQARRRPCARGGGENFYCRSSWLFLSVSQCLHNMPVSLLARRRPRARGSGKEFSSQLDTISCFAILTPVQASDASS